MQLHFYKYLHLQTVPCSVQTPHCSFVFANNKLWTRLLSYIIRRVVQAFGKNEARIAITFTHAMFHFSSLTINNSFECPLAAWEKMFMHLPILILAHKCGIYFHMKLSEETVKLGNCIWNRQKKLFSDAQQQKDQPGCNASVIEIPVYARKYCFG